MSSCGWLLFWPFNYRHNNIRLTDTAYTLPQVSFKSEFKDELKFIAKCRGSTKPARKNQNSSADNSNPTGSNQYMNSDRHYDYESWWHENDRTAFGTLYYFFLLLVKRASACNFQSENNMQYDNYVFFIYIYIYMHYTHIYTYNTHSIHQYLLLLLL